MDVYGKWFYGNEISEYGQKNGYVDYRTFAKAFDGVMANDFINQTSEIGYWEQTSGRYYEDNDGNTYDEDERDEKVEELEALEERLTEELDDIQQRMDETEDDKVYDELERDYKGTEERLNEVMENKYALEDEQYPEVYQWFIIDSNGARICEEANEIVYYNETLDLYLWGVTHYGTAWDYVLTNIRCNTGNI